MSFAESSPLRSHLVAGAGCLALIAALALERFLIPQILLYRLPTGAAAAPLLCATAAVVWLVTRHRRGKPIFAVDVAWMLLFTLVAVSAARRRPDAAMWCGFLPYGWGALWLIVVREVELTARRSTWIATSAALLLAATVIVDAQGLWWIDSAWRPSGLLLNKNFSGEYLALALPAALVALRGRQRILILPLIVALFETRCRTAWIAALAGSGLVACLEIPTWRRQRRSFVTILLVVSLVVAAFLMPARVRWAYAEKVDNASTLRHLVDLRSPNARTRWDEYRHTAGALARGRHLLGGLGPGQWASHTFLFGTFVPHSDYARVLSDGGAPALAVFAAWLGAALVAAWRRRRERPAQLAFAVALAITCISEAPLFRSESIPLVMLLLVAVDQHATPRANSQSSGQQIAPR